MALPRWIAGIRPRRLFVGPAGAALLVVCFFLPWARFSCGPGLGRTVSGPQLGGVAWLAVVAGLALIAAFALLLRTGRLHLAWPLPAAAAIVAIAAIASGLDRLTGYIHVGFTQVKPAGLSIHWGPGGIGAIAGLILLLFGTVLLLPSRFRRASPAGRAAEPVAGQAQPLRKRCGSGSADPDVLDGGPPPALGRRVRRGSGA